MKNQCWAYVIVAAISAPAGVAIAGPPKNVGTEPTIVVPNMTAPADTLALVTTEAPATIVDEPAAATPVEEAPSFGALDGDQVVAYIGRERS
jgi:hypothetical protein